MEAKFYRLITFFATILLFTLSSKAGHFSSGEIFYEWIGDEPGKGQFDYRVYATIFTNESMDIGVSTIDACYFEAGQRNQSTSFQLNFLPPSQGLDSNITFDNGNIYGWRATGISSKPNFIQGWAGSKPSCSDSSQSTPEYRYIGEVTLPGKSPDWVFALDFACCRDQADNFQSGNDLHLEAILNNSLGPNSSPRFLRPVQHYFCLRKASQRPHNYWQPADDKDNDSLVIDFAMQGSQSGSCGAKPTSIPYEGIYSASQPFPATSIQVNKNRGIFTFRPNDTGVFVTKFEVKEFRYDTTRLSWVNVGNTIREIPLFFEGSCNSSVTQSPSVCMVSFDPDTMGISLFLDASQVNLYNSLFVTRNLSSKTYDPGDFFRGKITDTSDNGLRIIPEKYQVAGWRKCGFYTDTSRIYRSIAVDAYNRTGDSVLVQWTPYVGGSVAKYRIYSGGTQFSNITLLDSVSSSATLAMVRNVPFTAKYFMVEGVLQDPSCLTFPNFNYDGPLGATRLKGIGIEENTVPEVAIHPNPTHGTVKVEVKQFYQEEVYSYKILNRTGQTVLKGSLKSETTKLNISDLPDGLYFLNFEGRNGVDPILKN